MPRIKCHYIDCVFVDEGYCSAALVEIDPDTGCDTYSPSDTSRWEAGRKRRKNGMKRSGRRR